MGSFRDELFDNTFTYERWDCGNRTNFTLTQNGEVLQSVAYTYDGLNRLIQEAEAGGLTQDYTYDARGNRAAMTVSGTENYTVSYAYDANNRLLTERKTRGLLTDLTTYTYDANGNLLSKTFTGGDGSLTGAAYTYNLFNQLSTAAENGLMAAYAYNAQGIRTCKATATSQTYFLLDGANVVGERLNGEYVSYLRGANLISRSEGGKDTYYLFNAHGDVTELVSDSGAVTHKYDYDAFGVEKKPDPLDANPFRYCGEYYDGETKTYYLRARYYDPNVGRFTQQDTHWTTANSIYGDNPQKINEREDKLGLKTYSYAPQITAVMQSGNLYVYGVNNPVAYVDSSGNEIAIACAIALIALAIGTTVAAFAILQKAIPDAYAALGDLLYKLGVLVKAAENLKECGKSKVADYVACKTDAQVASSDTKDKDEYKQPVSGKSGKEAADDVPSWAKGKRPKKGESGKEFAKRLLDEKYGKGNYTTGPGSEYNKIRKWGDRGFK